MEQKKETKKIVMQVSPLDKNLGTDEPKKLADKIRRKDTNKLRKVRKSFNDQGYRLPNIRDLIKRPGLYRLAWILDRMSVTDLAYFWDNWELDPVCVWAYRLAKFFNVPIQLETPVTMDEENE